MKKINLNTVLSMMLWLPFFALTTNNYASTPQSAFNLTGIGHDTMIQSCQDEPCSIAKVISAETTQQTADETTVRLTLLGGTQSQMNHIPHWNDEPHTVSVNCSLNKPSIEMSDYVMPIYFIVNEPVLPSDVTLYLKTCHNISQNNIQALSSLGYATTTFITP